MYIHEHDSKALLRDFGLPSPEGLSVSTVSDIRRATERMGNGPWMVKAQVLAGDRQSAGGICRAATLEEVVAQADGLIGSSMETLQSAGQQLTVNGVYIEPVADVARELYLAITIDTAQGCPVLLASTLAGTGIEKLIDAPENLIRIPLELDENLPASTLDTLSQSLHIEPPHRSAFVEIVWAMQTAFGALDATSIEINPLAQTGSGDFIALDVKVAVDDNAFFRHPFLEDLRDDSDSEARRAIDGYNFVALEGDIGCLVTGAALALATMDLVDDGGGRAANFVDLPPIATRKDVASAVQRIMDLPDVRVLLVNAVGGGMTFCDTVAEGLVMANKAKPLRVPLIVRFAGTSSEYGHSLLSNAAMSYQREDEFADAVTAAISAARSQA